MARKRTDEPERRPVLDARKKAHMLAVLVRNERAFTSVRDFLTVDHVRQHLSDNHAIVWQALLDFYANSGAMPDRATLLAEVYDLLGAAGDMFDDDDEYEIKQFVRYAYSEKEHAEDMPVSKAAADRAVNVCREFLAEIETRDLHRQVETDALIVSDLAGILQKKQARLSQLDALSRTDFSPMFPAGWDRDVTTALVPTGLSVVDRFFCGGMEGGEVALFMAPYGTCKTLTAVKLASLKVEQLAARWSPGSKEREVVIFVSTEAGNREIRNRMLITHARVPRRRLRNGIESLSRAPIPAATKDTRYEQSLFASSGGFVCEADRVAQAITELNRHVQFFNLAGSDPDYPGAGTGGVAELSQLVKAFLHAKPNIRPVYLIMDHASAMAKRMLSSRAATRQGDQEAVKRQILSEIPLLLRDLFAAKYDIGCWVTHQLTGAVGKKRPEADIHHSEAADSKAIAEFPDWIICCGTATKDRQLCKWNLTKHRREAPSETAIMQIRGDIGNIVDVSAHFSISNGRFISRAESSSFISSMPNGSAEDEDEDND